MGALRQRLDAGSIDADLGVSDQLRRVLPVHQSPIAPMPAQTCALNLGGSRFVTCFCASTAYRMLMGWAPNVVEADDVVLVWGAAGGLGSMAIQIVTARGGKAVAVVSDEDKRQFCRGQRGRWRHQSHRFQSLGAYARYHQQGMECLDEGGSGFRQGDLGCAGRAQKPEDCF